MNFDKLKILFYINDKIIFIAAISIFRYRYVFVKFVSIIGTISSSYKSELANKILCIKKINYV